MEEFVVRVFAGGMVNVLEQLWERFDVQDGDYVGVALVEEKALARATQFSSAPQRGHLNFLASTSLSTSAPQ